jgi:hypothetical protein
VADTADAWERIQPPDALEATWRLIRETNSYMEANEPWKAEPGPEVEAVLGDALEVLRIVAVLASPALVHLAPQIWARIGLDGSPADQRLPGAAAWGGYPGGLPVTKGEPLVPRLQDKEKGLPVILAGETRLEAGDQTVLEFNFGFDAPVFVVGVVAAFPGSESEPGKVTAVMDSRRLFKLVPPLIDPRRPGADRTDPGSFTSVVWSRDSADALRERLRDADIATDGVVETATAARVENGLVASTWAAGYVLAIGGVVLVLALAAGLVMARRLADRDSVSDVLLRRMSYRSGDLARARAWEVLYAVGTALVAAALGVGALVLAPTMIDAAAGIPPLSHPRPEVTDALPLVGVLVGLVLLAWLAGTVRTRRRSAAEVLRAGE